MNDQLTDPIEAARRSYAEELRFTAHIRSRAVFTAFAAVPRERFVGRARGGSEARRTWRNTGRRKMATHARSTTTC
jgi:protein-L-isoaspartate O-methyltransferase